jgi:hypothetical protein
MLVFTRGIEASQATGKVYFTARTVKVQATLMKQRVKV